MITRQKSSRQRRSESSETKKKVGQFFLQDNTEAEQIDHGLFEVNRMGPTVDICDIKKKYKNKKIGQRRSDVLCNLTKIFKLFIFYVKNFRSSPAGLGSYVESPQQAVSRVWAAELTTAQF